MFKNRTKVIQHLIANPTLYEWRFDIHTNSFEMFVDGMQFIVKNNGDVTLFEYDVVFVVKDGKRYLLVRRDDESLLKDLWIKLYNTYVSTTSDYYWEKSIMNCLKLKIKYDENGC